MADIAGTPYTWLHFDQGGTLADADVKALGSLITPGLRDLVIISHGWKTDGTEAWALYEPLWANVGKAWSAGGDRPLEGFAVAGVQWPSKPFRTDFDNPAPPAAGALSLAAGKSDDGDLPPAAFAQILSDFADVVGDTVARDVRAQAQQLAGGLDQGDPNAFVNSTRAALPSQGMPDAELAEDDSGYLKTEEGDVDGQAVLLSLFAPPIMPVSQQTGSALGLGADIQGAFQGPRAAIARFLNQLSYYEMKARAGVVGTALGSNVLKSLKVDHPVRLHLIGHSFGARLVTAAADAFQPRTGLSLHSLTLLEGAFSHNSMAASFPAVLGGQSIGPFSGVPGKVLGPISITHTHNDSACTIAYALASRVSRDNTLSIGDQNDEFGAMGANGAQKIPNYLQSISALNDKATYEFVPGKVHNVLGDDCIKDHMDVTNAEVGRFVAAALAV